MTQQQTDNKATRLMTAAILTNCMNLTLTGLGHDQAEALVVTQFERFDNLLQRAMLANGVNAADGTLAHPAGVFDDPPLTDPIQTLASIGSSPALAGLAAAPGGLAALTKALAPFLALIPGPAGQIAGATAAGVAALPPIAVPAK